MQLRGCLEWNLSLLHSAFWDNTVCTAHTEFDLAKVRYLEKTPVFYCGSLLIISVLLKRTVICIVCKWFGISSSIRACLNTELLGNSYYQKWVSTQKPLPESTSVTPASSRSFRCSAGFQLSCLLFRFWGQGSQCTEVTFSRHSWCWMKLGMLHSLFLWAGSVH